MDISYFTFYIKFSSEEGRTTETYQTTVIRTTLIKTLHRKSSRDSKKVDPRFGDHSGPFKRLRRIIDLLNTRQFSGM